MFSIKLYLKIGGLIAIFLICSSVFAQSSYYYYGGGLKRPLFLKKVLDKHLERVYLTIESLNNFL